MVRNYVRRAGSRKYRDYSEEHLLEAVERCRRGENMREVGEAYNIPYITLYRKIRNLHTKKPGGQTALPDVEEQAIVQCIVTAADWGFPMDSLDIKLLVENYLNQKGIVQPQFVNNKPGEGWMSRFLQRHSEQVSARMSQAIKESRAKVSHLTINKYFDHLAQSLNGIPPEAVVNYDETNFTDDPGRKKVVVRRASKRAEHIMDTSKAATSVMFSCSASGNLLPLYIVYKADHLWSTWTENGPPRARFNRSKSGWFDGSIFEDWFFHVIVPYFQNLPEGPKALIGDNLASHISFNVINKCRELNIKFILLPPNSTHMTQPLDVSVFRPVKGAWRKTLQQWKKHNKGVVRKDVFPRLLNQALNSIEGRTEDNIRAGFEATGIFPLDREKILCKLPKEVTEEAVNNLLTQSLTDLFQRSRFGNADTARGRKKKLNIEAGKSISQEDLEQNEPSCSNIKLNKKKEDKKIPRQQKKRNNNRQYGSSSESDHDSIPYADSDNEPETFSDLENCSEETEDLVNVNNGPAATVFEPEDFILVTLKTESGTSKTYVAKILNSKGNTFQCKFLRKSLKLKNAFVYPDVEDIGIVQRNEILEKLPQFKILRRGQISFESLEERHKGINVA